MSVFFVYVHPMFLLWRWGLLPVALWRVAICRRIRRRSVVGIAGWSGCGRRWRRLAGVFGGGACQRHIDFFLCKVLRLEKGDALLERRAGDGRVLQD